MTWTLSSWRAAAWRVRARVRSRRVCDGVTTPLTQRLCARPARVRRPSLGSVSAYVLHHAAAAVLVVKETVLHAGLV
jgi:hypothetical protein